MALEVPFVWVVLDDAGDVISVRTSRRRAVDIAERAGRGSSVHRAWLTLKRGKSELVRAPMRKF